METIYPLKNRIMHPIHAIVILYDMPNDNQPYGNTTHDVQIKQSLHPLTNLFITRNTKWMMQEGTLPSKVHNLYNL